MVPSVQFVHHIISYPLIGVLVSCEWSCRLKIFWLNHKSTTPRVGWWREWCLCGSNCNRAISIEYYSQNIHCTARLYIYYFLYKYEYHGKSTLPRGRWGRAVVAMWVQITTYRAISIEHYSQNIPCTARVYILTILS
jgi:hypothetical protein